MHINQFKFKPSYCFGYEEEATEITNKNCYVKIMRKRVTAEVIKTNIVKFVNKRKTYEVTTYDDEQLKKVLKNIGGK